MGWVWLFLACATRTEGPPPSTGPWAQPGQESTGLKVGAGQERAHYGRELLRVAFGPIQESELPGDSPVGVYRGVVRVALNAQGHPLEVTLVSSCGEEGLDRLVVRQIAQATDLPAPVPEILDPNAELHLALPFVVQVVEAASEGARALSELEQDLVVDARLGVDEAGALLAEAYGVERPATHAEGPLQTGVLTLRRPTDAPAPVPGAASVDEAGMVLLSVDPPEAGDACACGDQEGAQLPQGEGSNAYLNVVRREVNAHWAENLDNLPPDLPFDRPQYETKVRATLDAEGELLELELTQSCGLEALDQAVLNAWLSAAPFPQVPLELQDAQGRMDLPEASFTVTLGRTERYYSLTHGGRRGRRRP